GPSGARVPLESAGYAPMTAIVRRRAQGAGDVGTRRATASDRRSLGMAGWVAAMGHVAVGAAGAGRPAADRGGMCKCLDPFVQFGPPRRFSLKNGVRRARRGRIPQECDKKLGPLRLAR